MILVKPLENISKYLYSPLVGPIIFLSGSIEMGKAIDWQKQVSDSLKDEKCVILNPRRDDWDSSWKQNLDCKEFVEQVNWELNGLEKADIIVVHLEPNTTSPITLLEIGLYAQYDRRKLIIHCPEGYFRKGNIDVLCQRYEIQQADTLEELIEVIKYKVQQY